MSSDHAVKMTRFARAVLQIFQVTLLNMELTLGPDTGGTLSRGKCACSLLIFSLFGIMPLTQNLPP